VTQTQGVPGGSDALERAVTRVRWPTRQALLLLPVALDAILRLTAGDPFSGWYAAGLLVLALATLWTVLAAAAPRVAVVGSAVLGLDLAAIGLMRLVPDGNGLGYLAVLPGLWLGLDLAGRGVLLSFVGSVTLVSLPAVTYFGAQEAWHSRAVLIPVTVSMCALTMAGARTVWAQQRRELEDQRRQLAAALEQVTVNRALNDAIVSTVDVGLVALDRTGRYRSMNPRHGTFMELAFPDGHSGQAGHPGFVFAADRSTPVTRDEMPSIRAMRGEVFSDHVIWIGKDPAQQRALSVSAGPILDEDGSVEGAVLAYKDVTDLVTALRVKDEFVASVSHELRTPLTAIMGFLDLALEEADLDPTVRQRLTVVKRNAVRLLRLVDDLLLTAKLDDGQLTLELRDTDLAAVVTSSLSDLAPRARAGDVTVRSEVGGPVVVAADPVRIRQVVDNLVGNAVKYTPPGGTVDVGLRSVGGEGQLAEIELTVCDSGIGISTEDQSRLFTRFFRAEDAAARAIQGIGLGLAITRSIVLAHGGTIEAESELGRGSTFRVRLPRSSILDFSSVAPGRSGARSPVSTKPARS